MRCLDCLNVSNGTARGTVHCYITGVDVVLEAECQCSYYESKTEWKSIQAEVN